MDAECLQSGHILAVDWVRQVDLRQKSAECASQLWAFLSEVSILQLGYNLCQFAISGGFAAFNIVDGEVDQCPACFLQCPHVCCGRDQLNQR